MKDRVIRIHAFADESPCEFADTYVVAYDPSVNGFSPSGEAMNCLLAVTKDRAAATRYTVMEAFEVWSKAHGVRPDGHPNRPLTAFTVSIEFAEEPS